MYQFRSISRIIIILIVALTCSSCEELSSDACDGTVKPEIAVTIRATVHIRDLNDDPIPNEFINFEISKKPCGAPEKGKFTYKGNTDEFGNWSSPVVGYNLRNSKDIVQISAIASQLDNYFERNFEYVEFKYGDFSTLSTKQVDLYIFAKLEN